MQRDVTRAALTALEGTQFALAGSGAIREHGLTDRPTQDVDLFTSDVDATRFSTAVDTVINELRLTGLQVDERRRVESFAQLLVTTSDGRFVEIDMGVDSREGDPVTLSVGAVLSLDDAVGNKVSALYSRAEDRDYLDVDAIRMSGKFTDAQLVDAAGERDAGFGIPMFITQLERAQRLTPERVADYGVQPAQLAAIKERFATWTAELRATASTPPVSPNLAPDLQRGVDAPQVRNDSVTPTASHEHNQERLRKILGDNDNDNDSTGHSYDAPAPPTKLRHQP
ncbi:hypothetical protein D4765_10150 [Subtercola vilae]|uniref:Nucleotidyl transferase AbiEii/AbiGii toxin family protein n=1 Tax=Subtercola vilae TaxID=2056433 RepID=A0A4T2C283_9MICO|nr:hypothetical protein D4765_10150 [Subtercola vilae]